MRLTEAPVLPPLPAQEYAQLRDSIRERGVLQPLLITNNHVLIDGHERWKAICELGLSKYPIRIIGNLDEAERVDLAIRTNLERRHLTVAQRRELAARLLKTDPGRTNRSVAGTVGCDHKTVGKIRGRLLQDGEIPNLGRATAGRDGKTYHYPATSVEHPTVARIAGKILSELGDDAPEGGASLRTLNKKRYELDREEILGQTAPSLPRDFKIYNTDFRHLGNRIAPNSVQLVVSDPPWLTEHADLRKPFAETVSRILKPGGFACIYTGHFHLKEFMDALCDAGLEYRWLIACVNDDSMGAIRSSASILTFWRPVLLFQKPGGKAKTPRLLRDLIASSGKEKGLHEWQQPIAEAVQFVKTLSEPGDLCADLCVGSGTVPAAVATVGEGRRFLGTEIDGEMVRAAKLRVKAVLRGETEMMAPSGLPMAR
jgi:tRNA G46 methylase TrmB